MANPKCYEGDLFGVEMNSQIEAKQQAKLFEMAQGLMGYQPEQAGLELLAKTKSKGIFDGLFDEF